MVANTRLQSVPMIPAHQGEKAEAKSPVASVENNEEEEKKPRVFEETEVDIKADRKKRQGLEPPMRINVHDTTINCLVDQEQHIISAVYGDGFERLNAQARANYGVKRGRYYWEIQFLECHMQRPDFRIGVSLAGAQWVGGEQSICFGNYCNVRAGGEKIAEEKTKNRFVDKTDIVGVLLNTLEARDTGKVNSNTISLFVNGERASEPIPLPADMVGKTLFPHIGFKNCTVHINFGPQLKSLPFTVHTFAQAATTELEKSKCGDDADTLVPKAVLPVGQQEGWAKEFVEKAKEPFMELTEDFFKAWMAESGVQKYTNHQNPNQPSRYGLNCLDNPLNLLPWINIKQKSVIYDCNQRHLLFAEERAKVLHALSKHDKLAVVVKFETKTKQEFWKHAEACLPTDEEGFSKIEYVSSKDEAEVALEAWKYDQKLRSKVEDLKIGDTFKEKNEAWTKFVTEKKETDEGKEFSDEDWMLADLRAEFLHILEAFKVDVNDETRPSFPPNLFALYYRLYLAEKKKPFNPLAFACPSMEALLKSKHLSDTIELNERNLLVPKLENVTHDAIYELVKKQRKIRLLRVGAGDELSELQFSAKNPPPMMKGGGGGGGAAYYQVGGYKGKGYKGGKRPGGYMHGPAAQRPRY